MTLFTYHKEHVEKAKPVLQMLADGLTTWQIAQKLKMSEGQVETLVEKMRKHNDCRNITTLIVKAMRERVVK